MGSCLICGSTINTIKDTQIKVTYSHCESCDFLYKNKSFHLTDLEEKKQYDFHNNSMENEGYVNIFLNLYNQFIYPLEVSKNILEYGSGPGPVLYQILSERYQNVYHYDPYYHPDDGYLKRKYELITCTEVVEHFYDPMSEFRKLVDLLEPKGYLLLMTNFRTMEIDAFLTWWYRRDLTHVSFYSFRTFEHIARQLDLEIINQNSKNIILFQKK